MKHYPDSHFLETKAEGDDAESAALAAIEKLGTSIEGKFEKLDDEVKALNDRLDAEEAKSKRPGGGDDTKSVDEELQIKAFDIYIRKGKEALNSEEVKALTSSNDPQGGYLAPAQFIAELDRNVVLFSPVRSVARVMSTGAGVVELPKRTGTMTGSWVGEIEDRPETAPSFGQNSYPVQEIAAYVDVSNALLEDSAFNIDELLAFEFGEEFGAKEGTAFVTGDGNKKPIGFMSDPNVGFTVSGHASQVTADGVIDAYHALKSPYRPNAVWGMNSTTMGAIRKLKDTTNNYLLATAGISGAPASTLLGRPVLEFPDMPDVGAGNFPIVFGDFRAGYRIFDRIPISILRDPYSQATKGMTRFHGRRRVAGGVAKAEAFRKLKIST